MVIRGCLEDNGWIYAKVNAKEDFADGIPVPLLLLYIILIM